MKKYLFACAALLAVLAAMESAAAQPVPGMMGGGPMARFQAMDRNGDGAITQDELAAGHDVMFQQMDANGDGVLSKAEFMAMPGMAARRDARFAELDANKDGQIDRPEWQAGAGQPMMALHDLNGDGKITADEMGPGMMRGPVK